MWLKWGFPYKIMVVSPLLPMLKCQAQALTTRFHRFLARFSGRRRSHHILFQKSNQPQWALLLYLVIISSIFKFVDACSSRTTPKPRPPAPTIRPNITFHTYECPPAYAAWYCLNGATCFTAKIGDSLLYNCECAEGYMGPRCEYKDLDGSYMPSHRRFMLETASIASGAIIAVFLVIILCVGVYLQNKRRSKLAMVSADCVDGGLGRRTRTFGTRWRSQCPVSNAVTHSLVISSATVDQRHRDDLDNMNTATWWNHYNNVDEYTNEIMDQNVCSA